MKIVYFTHSLRSCWNHGNAHFVRGVMSELLTRGYEAVSYEPEESWSLGALVADHGTAGLKPFHTAYPELNPGTYGTGPDLAELTDGADLVIVHEWNEPALVAGLGALRKNGAPWTLLFHDTHHRAVSASEQMLAYDLTGYDGVLAFGEALSEVYRGWGWGDRVWTWHEAADLTRFHPPEEETHRQGLIWIGNWGDGERTAELDEYLLRPASDAGLPLAIHGVRYPDKAKALLARYGVDYRGWAANAAAPALFAERLATVHVPRRPYTRWLPGIPTIRVFEALACGIPLASAPWDDEEGLFRPGDFLMAQSGEEMTRHLRALSHDPALRASLAANGWETVSSRHSCARRVDELLGIVEGLRGYPEKPSPALRERVG